MAMMYLVRMLKKIHNMFHRTYTCKIVSNFFKILSKRAKSENELRDGTNVLSSTLSSFQSMMVGNKPRRVHHLDAMYHPIRRSDSSQLT